jgi:hypothetical protein
MDPTAWTARFRTGWQAPLTDPSRAGRAGGTVRREKGKGGGPGLACEVGEVQGLLMRKMDDGGGQEPESVGFLLIVVS